MFILLKKLIRSKYSTPQYYVFFAYIAFEKNSAQNKKSFHNLSILTAVSHYSQFSITTY